MKTGNDLIDEAKARVRQVTGAEALARVTADANVLLLDVREPNEWNLGHAPTAMSLARGLIETNVEGAIDRDRPIIVYCAAGNRSALSADTLQQMGYKDVSSMIGGFRAWVDAGGDIDDD